MRRREGRWKEDLHVWVLVSFAVAQPLYDLLGTQAEFFVFQNAGRVEILVLIVALSGLLPLALVGVERLAGFVGLRTERGVHYAVVAAGVGLTALPALRPVEAVPGIALVYAALVLGAGVAVLYARFGSVRLFFTLLAPAVVVFPVMFLAASPVTPLLVQEERARALAPAAIGSPAPIVFVVLDEFPTTSLMDAEERIDADRYPNFAALARDATWYRRATTVGENTYDAVPAILTGRYPRAGRLPHAIDHPENLFTLLAGAYRMHASGVLTQLCPKGLCTGDVEGDGGRRLRGMLTDVAVIYGHTILTGELSRLLPPIDQGWSGFGRRKGGPAQRGGKIDQFMAKRWRERDDEEDRWERARRFTEAIQESSEPRMYFGHLMLPHHHYEYLPSGRRYRTEEGMPGLTEGRLEERRHANDAANVHRLYQRHLLQVGAMDTWLGELTKQLRDVDLYDRAIIVVTADHGIAFRAGEHYRAATEVTFQDLLAIPLFIKGPFQTKGRIDDRVAETVDILPTVAELIKTEIPWRVDGRSLLGTRAESGEEVTVVHRLRDLEATKFMGLTEAMGRAAKRRDRLFGSGPWEPGLYRLERYRKLIGRKTEELKTEERGEVAVTLDNGEQFTGVEPTRDIVPVYITGEVGEGAEGDRVTLGVAINGTIQAVTEPWELPIRGREGYWQAMVPESALLRGRNTVEIFVIREEAEEVRLIKAGGTEETQQEASGKAGPRTAGGRRRANQRVRGRRTDRLRGDADAARMRSQCAMTGTDRPRTREGDEVPGSSAAHRFAPGSGRMVDVRVFNRGTRGTGRK